MKEITDLAKALANEIKNSAERKNYIEMKAKIEGSPEIYKKIVEFEKLSQSLELRRIKGEDVSFDEDREIGRLYAEIYMHSDGGKFLEAKKKLFSMLNTIYKYIGENCGIDI